MNDCRNVRFSNRPVWVKRFQAIHQYSVDVARGLALLFGIGIKALPSWGSRIRRNNLLVGLAVDYTDMAVNGFFKWLSAHFPAAHIFVECKNYGREIGNPELDQLSGRFSPSRGKVGILVCRSLQNRNQFIQRCIDTARDSRGFVLVLDDDNLAALVQTRRDDPAFAEWPLLRDQFRDLIM